MPWLRPDLRVLAAGVRAVLVDGAAARARVEELAVAVGAARHREDAVLLVVALDLPAPDQPAGDQAGLFMLGLEGVDQTEAHQVGQADLDRHGAAVGGAAVAEAGAVAGPGLDAIDVDEADRGAHDDRKGGDDVGCGLMPVCREADTRSASKGGRKKARLVRAVLRLILLKNQALVLVAKGGIEPPTRGFSIRCSTN